MARFVICVLCVLVCVMKTTGDGSNAAEMFNHSLQVNSKK